jgi:Mg-chelatase subunit ChlI
MIAMMTSNMRIDGHRADLVILKAARAHAAYEGRDRISRDDILMAIELTIPHRLKRGPFADAYVNMETLSSDLEQVEATLEEGDEGQVEQGENSNQQMDSKKKAKK